MNNKFFFILVKPQLGENIGACARSLKNFHFSKLRLVSPKALWPNEKAKATSVGAYDIIRNAKVFKNTGDAVKDCDIVVSLSARKRDISKRHISITQFSKKIKASKNKNLKDVDFWVGKRAQVGKKVPKGFNKNLKFST